MKIIVLDDDPTGSQTVHSCLLLLRWDIETLKLGLDDSCDIFFILTNTRALDPTEAKRVTQEVCHNLKLALKDSEQDFLVVSRSDSTLRGHYPLETDVIASELGGFDAHFLLPAFFEGGRITRDSIHYLIVNGLETPVDQTEFAKDSVFAYSHSYLPDYVEQKTKGQIKAQQVVRILSEDIRKGSLNKLLQLSGNVAVVVDGETQAEYDLFARDLIAATKEGKRFLLRSAASILTSLADLGPQSIASEKMAQYKRTKDSPGVVLVGSHVQKTTQQLESLLQQGEALAPIEVQVSLLKDQLEKRDEFLAEILYKVHDAHQKGLTPVIYTSRGELSFADTQTRLAFGVRVSTFLMDIVQGLPSSISYLISKGGITSNDVLSVGLNLRAVRLLGQILPGCSLVTTPEDHPLFANLPVVLFPGNVGDQDGLLTVYRRLK